MTGLGPFPKFHSRQEFLQFQSHRRGDGLIQAPVKHLYVGRIYRNFRLDTVIRQKIQAGADCIGRHLGRSSHPIFLPIAEFFLNQLFESI